ncbi:hypothetical protein NQ317_007554 [Molorchus minor]|uniref:phospholipase D n=1 Tax=Molorchus minor TaxID=1323400 RepID=A0ABQ9K495_9CUCU|nr:hypothetical protein NQ317_007554 [Molorchus minor]
MSSALSLRKLNIALRDALDGRRESRLDVYIKISMENVEENEESNEMSLTRPSLGSDGDYDDELGVPESIKLVDMGDGPVAIVNSDEELEGEHNDALPYSTIQNYKKFKSYHRDVFIPGVDIIATITDYERNLTSHMLNPNFTWKLQLANKKRYKQFQTLHQTLVLFRTSLNIPFPSKTHKNKRKTFRENAPVSDKGKRKSALPRFPKKPEILVTHERLGNRMKQIESYLNNMLSITIYRNHPATIEFLEVSHLSFINGLGIKGKEGLIHKKTGSTHPGQSGCNCFGLYHCLFCIRCQHICNDVICSRWVKKVVFHKGHLLWLHKSRRREGKVASGMYALGLQTGFQIQTLCRQVTFRCWTRRKSREWIDSALKETAEFTQPNPHHSLAPVRTSITASWFVDGATYMSAVADAIHNAKDEIFITDWWLSPEIYLKRPAIAADYWQLNKLLDRKAKSGVKIYILLYKEVEVALGLNSYYSKQKLLEASDNIKVLRHPDHARAGILFWAHHEKMVVVDQTYAFLGGLDLCYGRWDDHLHKLTDLGSMTPSIDVSTLKKKSSSTPSGDSIYPIPTPFYKQCPMPEIREPNTPTEETCPSVAPTRTRPDKSKLNTPGTERKNIIHDIKDTIKTKGKELIHLMYTPNENGECTEEQESPREQCELSQKDLQTPEQIIESLNGSAKLWIGKDYVNFIVKDFTNLDSPFDDFIDRVTTPRMPWHDVGVCVQDLLLETGEALYTEMECNETG